MLPAHGTQFACTLLNVILSRREGSVTQTTDSSQARNDRCATNQAEFV